MTVYRVETASGRAIDGRYFSSLDQAKKALKQTFGWKTIFLSPPFAMGSQEGPRGSIYGVEAYSSSYQLSKWPEGNPRAPRILRIEGDESWALGHTDRDRSRGGRS